MGRIRGLIAAAMFIAASAKAVTYVVPSDRNLVKFADAIAIATAIESHAERNEAGGVVTVTTFAISESIKGTLTDLRVTEPGGSLGGTTMLIPGSPRFVDGSRYLLLLHRMPNGQLTTHALGLGKFDFSTDFDGREIVSRGAVDTSLRSAPEFLNFIRAVVKNADAPVSENYLLSAPRAVSFLALRPAPTATRSDYLFETKPRWNNNATVAFSYCCAPALQPSPFDGVAGATSAVNAWDATGAIHYTIAGVTTANKGLTASDGTNGVLFNDPNNELAAFGVGVVALGGFTGVGATYTVGSETFSTAVEADVVVGKNTQFPNGVTQALFAAVLTHEFGHTLGFRHADGTGSATSPPPACLAPSPCSFGGQAIMESIVQRATLGQWDIDAATTVYGVACTGPAISAQPQSATITSGGSTTLSVTATGTSVTYQWFTGNPGSGTAINGATNATVSVTPASTTTYYVAVSACGTTVNSSAATVTVNPSTGPCGSSANDLCLNSSRYRVTLTATGNGITAPGVPVRQSDVFGYFSLPGITNNASNPEVFVKTVGPVNGVPWVFYAGLTNLDYRLTVVDTQGTFNQTYHVSPPPSDKPFRNIGDFDVFGSTAPPCADVSFSTGTGSTSSCATTSSALCLLNRFSVTLQAKDNPTRTNNTGPGAAVAGNELFGFFTVPALASNPSDIQLFVKMVDARVLGSGYWVFFGGLTDFDLTLTVRDTQLGRTKTYNKPPGSTCGMNDTAAFTP